MSRELGLDGTNPYVITPMILLTDLSGLTDAEKVTLQVLLYFDFGRVVYKESKPVLLSKGYCDVSLDRLSALRGIHRRTIQLHISRLIDLGYIRQDPSSATSTRKYIELDPGLSKTEELENKLAGLGLRRKRTEGSTSSDTEKDPGEQNFSTPGEQKFATKVYNKTSIYKNITTTSSASPSEEAEQMPIDREDGGDIPSLNLNKSERLEKPLTEGPISEESAYDEFVDTDITSFLSGDVVPKTEEKPKKKSKDPVASVRQKIASGDFGKITPKDLLVYFKELYILKYHRQYSVPSAQLPKVLSMLSNSFIAKYGQQKCIGLIDLLFERHKSAGLSSAEFPRPNIYNLTQDWIINKILDVEVTSSEYEAIASDSEARAVAETTFGPHKKVDPSTISTESRVFLIKHNKFDKFARLCNTGFISPDLLHRLADLDITIIEEVSNLGS